MSMSSMASSASRPDPATTALANRLACRIVWTRRTMVGSSSTSKMRGPSARSRMCRVGPLPESNPGEFLPPSLAPPRVPQTSQAPVKRELAKAEVLHHGIQQEYHHVATAAEGQQSSLEPVCQAKAKAPGAHEHGHQVDQNAVSQGGEQEGPEIVIVEESVPEHLFHDEEEQHQQVPGQLDQRAVVLEDPERRQGEPADSAELATP